MAKGRLKGDGHPRDRAAERLVFVDEMGTNTSLHPLYAWSSRGERARCKVPRNRGLNNTTLLLASITAEGMGPCLAVEGATTRVVFEAYVEKVLVRSLRHAQVMVMDNLYAHKGERIRELLESAGWELLIPAAVLTGLHQPHRRGLFSKVKGLVRRAEARSREALVEAMGVRHLTRSPPKMQEASSSTADTVLRVNCFDRRCRIRATSERSSQITRLLLSECPGPFRPYWTFREVRRGTR